VTFDTNRTRTMNRLPLASGLFTVVVASVVSCGGSSGSPSGPGASAGTQMRLTEVSNGFGRLLPHTTLRAGSTTEVVDLNTIDDILANVTTTNPVLPTPTFEATAILPSGEDGNHFISASFTRPLDVLSILDPNPSGGGSNGLVGSITVVATDPLNGAAVPVTGRAFINGMSYAGPLVDGQFELQPWVAADEDGNLVANPAIDNDLNGIPDGLGFPGTVTDFAGATKLVGTNVFTFIVDSDDNLATYETFPVGMQIRIDMNEGVAAVGGRRLVDRALACTTVGPDVIPPQPRRTPPPQSLFITSPSGGSVGIDPLTPIVVEFTEPVQPTTVGEFPLGRPPQLSPALSVAFGPDTSRVDVPFNILPVSPFDLSRFELQLAFNLPGDGPADAPCGVFNRIDILASAAQFQDLSGNLNSLNGSASYTTGEGPGLVNAPVTPDTVYVARTGAEPGISVIDLNGFGGGTGNPVYDPTFQTFQRGWTYFPLNPNVLLQGSTVFPPLGPGSCTVNGGSSGVFTLSKDSALNDKLVRSPLLLSIGDMALGQSLDTTFNNGPAPYGCQSGTGNLCAQDGFKNIVIILGGPNTIIPQPLIPNNAQIQTVTGTANIASWAPSPNPPPLLFPPLCASPFLAGQEPTSIESFNNAAVTNQLAPGDAFGDPLNGVPPSGLLTSEQNTFWFGPSRPSQTPAGCATYMLRQQVGQYLYMIDRGAREVVVFNSNRMIVVDRIPLPDPTEFAMGTNLDFLAVTNQSVDTVSFIDIDPGSSTFHQVIIQTVVGDAPRGIAWDSANEDILVCNEGGNSMSIISANTLQVRKTVSSQLNQPFAVAITPRQIGFGFQRFVYFAYVLNRNGTLAVFESGPNSVNGWGYDDVIGIMPYTFQNPQTIQPDHRSLNSGLWIAHEGKLDLVTGQPGSAGTPALTQLEVTSGVVGPIALGAQSLLIPNFRDMAYSVRVSLGPETLSGIPVDIAFDNLRNFSGLTNYYTNDFSAGFPQVVNGKSLARTVGNAVRPSNLPSYVFVAVPNPQQGSEGLVHVIDASGYSLVDTNPFSPGTQSIEVTGATVLMDYFRQ